MNTKLNLIMAATAVLGFASCEKYVPATANGDDAEYVIVIDGAEGTKAAASRSLDFADLTGNTTGKFTATLQKRNRETGLMENVSFQPDWSWSKDSEAFSGSQDENDKNKYGFAAQAVGSGNVNVSASYCGNALASAYATVTVADSRAITWTDPTSTVTSGSIYSATLNCNFAGTVTVSSNNSSFLVGESTGSLSSTASVTFSESTGTAKTIYYKYTGSEETTVNMNAASAGFSSAQTVSCVLPAEPEYELILTIPTSGIFGMNDDVRCCFQEDPSSFCFAATAEDAESGDKITCYSIQEDPQNTNKYYYFRATASEWADYMGYLFITYDVDTDEGVTYSEAVSYLGEFFSDHTPVPTVSSTNCGFYYNIDGGTPSHVVSGSTLATLKVNGEYPVGIETLSSNMTATVIISY